MDWPAQAWDPNAQAGWVGYGWSLEPSAISRQNVGGWDWKETGGSCQQNNSYSSGDVYSLALNGAGHDLVLGDDNYYHTDQETYWRVWTSGGTYPDAWYVRTTDGSTYTFSDTLWQVICHTSPCTPSVSGTHQPYKWLLTEARDVHGNKILYEYETRTVNCPLNGQQKECHEAAYLSKITYNYTGSQALVQVEFGLGTRQDDDYAQENSQRCPSKFVQLKKLDTVTVSVYQGSAWQTVRTYDLDYNYSTYDDDVNDDVDKGKLTLSGIQLCGTDGSTCLPPITYRKLH